MEHLSIDIETYSPVDIKKAGAYRYAEEAEVLLFAYSVDYGPVQCVDLTAGEEIPAPVMRALTHPGVIKHAFNAAFERAVLSRTIGAELDPAQWRCTMVLAARAGYPLSLDSASTALGTAEKKDKRGNDLIRYFCVPCKPTKANGGRTRNMPEHAPEKWAEFIEYCKQDVVTEQAIEKKLNWIPVSHIEHEYWNIDQRANERGVRLDLDLVRAAIEVDSQSREMLVSRAQQLTGLDNPNSNQQLTAWLQAEGVEIENLQKQTIKNLLADGVDGSEAEAMLKLRQELAKSSIKKYQSMLDSAGEGDRVRGTIQFYGANRTGRNSGRILQPQNLPRMSMDDAEIETARAFVRSRDAELVMLGWDSVPDVLSQLIRTAICAAPGYRLLVSDFSAIESRVLAWLAGEQWKLDVFETHGKIYEATAARMFKVPFESITKGSEMRQRGKVAELACGFGGGANAITTMDLDRAIPDEIKPALVKSYRDANKNIVKFWYDLEDAAFDALDNPGETFKAGEKISFTYKRNVLLMRLPSGRYLHYPKPSIGVNRFGGPSIIFWGVDQTTKKWCKQETYSGKLSENATQATARDILMNGIYNLEKAGYKMVMNVHDEVVCEMKNGRGSIAEMNELMCKKAQWMAGLPLSAEGFESEYYKK